MLPMPLFVSCDLLEGLVEQSHNLKLDGLHPPLHSSADQQLFPSTPYVNGYLLGCGLATVNVASQNGSHQFRNVRFEGAW